VKLEQYDHALKELETLRKLMPKEAPIPFLMGKIYKKLKLREQAHYHFTLALDLDSKDSQKIKQYIESLHTNQQNDFDEDIEF
jgi:anaphase-promoting complex subunit 3